MLITCRVEPGIFLCELGLDSARFVSSGKDLVRESAKFLALSLDSNDRCF